MVHGAWNENPYGYILVGGIPTPLKNMSSSVGMMRFPIYGKIKFMFQTTNQSTIDTTESDVNKSWTSIPSPV